jgi:hypothetical protein
VKESFIWTRLPIQPVVPMKEMPQVPDHRRVQVCLPVIPTISMPVGVKCHIDSIEGGGKVMFFSNEYRSNHLYWCHSVLAEILARKEFSLTFANVNSVLSLDVGSSFQNSRTESWHDLPQKHPRALQQISHVLPIPDTMASPQVLKQPQNRY